MRRAKKKKTNFKDLLSKYLEIKGLDIIIVLSDGEEIELYKNREIVKNEIITHNKENTEKQRIPLSKIKSVDLFAA